MIGNKTIYLYKIYFIISADHFSRTFSRCMLLFLGSCLIAIRNYQKLLYVYIEKHIHIDITDLRYTYFILTRKTTPPSKSQTSLDYTFFVTKASFKVSTTIFFNILEEG